MARRRRRTAARRRRSLPEKPWAMLAYIAGDNNLSDAGLEDIQEMCEEGASPDVHVGVQIDTYGEHEGTLRYEVTAPDATGVAHRIVVERLPEDDSGDPQVLRKFLTWGLGRYRAERRLVVVWNHGAGFRAPRRDIAYDDFGGSLDMPEIAWAMGRAGVSRTSRLQILGFDACLMSMVEVVHHLRDLTEYVVGSQQTEPGDGWPYDRVLARMKRTRRPDSLARAIVAEYIKSYRAIGAQNVTQSAVVTDRTEAVVAALGALGAALAPAGQAHRAALRKVRAQVQSYEDFPDYVDVVHFADLIARHVTDPRIPPLARALRVATEAAVLDHAWYGAAVKHSHGLSMWWPESRAVYVGSRAKYLALDFARTHKGWVKFLDAYLT